MTMLQEPTITTSEARQCLIIDFEPTDPSSMTDMLCIYMANAERSLLQMGARPGIDYTYHSLLTTAMPLVRDGINAEVLSWSAPLLHESPVATALSGNRQRLTPDFAPTDPSSMIDMLCIFMVNVECSLLQMGARPGIDYTYHSLLTAAMPLVRDGLNAGVLSWSAPLDTAA